MPPAGVLADKVAVATGTAAGLSASCAELMAARSAAAVGTDVDAVDAERTAERLGHALAVPTDVADPGSIEKMVATAAPASAGSSSP